MPSHAQLCLVVGLGNPGPRYAGSPHNVGFDVLDLLAAGTAFLPAFEGVVAETRRLERTVHLLKPMTFMNCSGRSLRRAMSALGAELSQIVVVHDELDLPLGKLRLKRGGGEAGHNGLLSVSAECGGRDFWRLRVGVGPAPAGAAAEYLLSRWPAVLASEAEAAIQGGAKALEQALTLGPERAMNEINRRREAVAPSPPAGAATSSGEQASAAGGSASTSGAEPESAAAEPDGPPPPRATSETSER